VLLSLLVLLAAVARAPAQPLPAWFDEVPVAVPEGSGAGRAATEWLLADRQIRVDEHGRMLRASRYVLRINSPEGVSDGAEEHVTYDPSYERVVFHRANVLRGGKTLDALRGADFRVLNRETALEAQLLDGRLSAVLILRDVRPGDVIDYAWTVESKPPQLAGHYADVAYLGSDEAVARLRHRLLWPAARPLHLQLDNGAPAPRIRELGAEREYQWDAPAVALQIEKGIPGSYDPYPAVELSDFDGWGAVARWALPLFAADPAAVAEVAGPWRSLSEEERATRALTFAREQIRYFGMEMGINGHKPHPPGEVLARRYGDCKDKALLLVSLLRASGIQAAPALVNTHARSALDGRLPSAYAFNHAVVRARIAGVERWLDATLTSQRGDVAALPGLDYERALVLEPGAEGLSRLPPSDAAEPSRIVEETVHARERDKPATMDVVTTFLGRDADAERAAFTQDAARVGSRFLDFYKTYEPQIEQRAVPKMRDEPSRDRLQVVESYSISGYWRDEMHDVFVEEARQLRPPLDASSRTMPLALPFPLHVREVLRLELPAGSDPDVLEGARDFSGPGVTGKLRTTAGHDQGGPIVTVTADLSTTAPTIEAREVKRYAEVLSAMGDATSLRVRLGRRTAAAAVAHDEKLGWLGLVFVGLLFGLWLGAPAMVRRFEYWRSRRFLRRTLTGAGESANTPLRVGSVAELQAHVLQRRCLCGRGFQGQPLEPGESAVVGGRTVHAVRVRCVCSRVTAVHFVET
jgi:hypothetical protein